jgi:hypothetical protein
MRLKLPNPVIHRQQHLNDSLTTSVKDRLRLSPLHSYRFDETQLCPPDQLNAYTFSRSTQRNLALGNNLGWVARYAS